MPRRHAAGAHTRERSTPGTRPRFALSTVFSQAEKEIAMFVMTEAAGGFLTRILEEAHATEDTAVRFVIEGAQVTPKLDTVQPGDDVFAHAGRKVLIVDKGVSRALGSSILDVEKTMNGSKLILMH